MRAARQRQSVAVFVSLVDHEPAAVACLEWAVREDRHCANRSPGVAEELGVLLLEGQRDFADRPVAVLGDDQVGLARTLGVLVVVLVAVDEHHQVGVLLEVPGLAQIGELGHLRRALLDRARELRERDHRHAQLAREDLQPAAQLAHGRHARVIATVGAHQLQVVDDDQPQPVLALAVQPARLRADLQHAPRRSSRPPTAAPPPGAARP